jgi:hypothetical protein
MINIARVLNAHVHSRVMCLEVLLISYFPRCVIRIRNCGGAIIPH